MARYRQRRQARYDYLKSYGFLPFEARELSKVVDRRATYFRRMLLDRQEVIEQVKRDAEYNRFGKRRTYQEIVRYVRYIYQEERWEFNHAGVWQMYRDYRDKAITMDEYYPKKRKKKRFGIEGARIDRGKLREQRQRYKEKRKRLGY